MYSSSQFCCGPTTNQMLYIRCWKTFSGFLNMYLRLGGPYTISVASPPPLSSAAFQNVRLSISSWVIKKQAELTMICEQLFASLCSTLSLSKRCIF